MRVPCVHEISCFYRGAVECMWVVRLVRMAAWKTAGTSA